MEKVKFGTLKDGTEISLFRMENKAGMKIAVTDLGATLVSVLVKDADGVLQDVVLGYDTPQEYVDQTCYFGAVIGRNGNRIDKGRFTINGVTSQLAINDNENNLHSGPDGYDIRRWKVVKEEAQSLTLALDSPDGDQGFPGNFHVEVTYTLTDENEVVLHYTGICDADTVANLTNHTYFNLAGHESGTILDQKLQLFADYYTPVRDEQAIPTGEIAAVAGTPMDFTVPKEIGREIDAEFEQLRFVGGYDHNYVLSREAGVRRKMAEAFCRQTGIRMEAYTDCPGVQFYAGNFITPQKGKGGASYDKRQGFCLESQYYPNSVNQEGFASPVLKAGKKYDTTTSYRFFPG